MVREEGGMVCEVLCFCWREEGRLGGGKLEIVVRVFVKLHTVSQLFSSLAHIVIKRITKIREKMRKTYLSYPGPEK